MITKLSFLDKTKMATIYIKTKVTRTDIHTHAHVVSIDNGRYEYPGFSRVYERRVQLVHRFGTRRTRNRPVNLWRAPIASTIDVLFWFFLILLVSSACPQGPKAVSFRLAKFLLETIWPFSFSKPCRYSVTCQSVKVTINTNKTIDKVPTDISLCPLHARC